MSSPPIAVVDIGTNSTRLLVAEVEDGACRGARAADQGHPPRRGRGRDRAAGRRRRWSAVAAAVAAYREMHRPARRGAGRGRGHQRRARRRERRGVPGRLRERFGIEARTISGDEEARLTFLGATAGVDAGEHAHARDRHRRRQHRVRDRAGPGGEPDVPRVHAHGLGPPDRAPPPLRPARTGRARRARAPTSRASSTPRSRPRCATACERASPWRAPPPRSPPSTSELEPYDPERVHGYALGLRRVRARCSPGSPRLPLERAAGGSRAAPRPRADDRRRRGDPRSRRCALRARRGRGQRGGHPPRRRRSSGRGG